MIGNAINTKSEALEPHELSSEELDAVSGGAISQAQENYRQMQAMKVFAQALKDGAGV
jgi:hypothetical protein